MKNVVLCKSKSCEMTQILVQTIKNKDNELNLAHRAGVRSAVSAYSYPATEGNN